MNADLPEQIHTELGDLNPDVQLQVLAYVRALKQNGNGMLGAGMSGATLKKLVGTISTTDAKSMMDAIEAGCEQVNLDEW